MNIVKTCVYFAAETARDSVNCGRCLGGEVCTLVLFIL